MICQLIFLVALLEFGQPQNQCVREVRSLKNDLQVELRDVLKETIKSTNHSVSREDVQELVEDKATKKDVRKRANEVIQALNFSVATGNKHIMETLLQILESQDGIKNATTLNNDVSLVPADQCVTRDEVREVIREEVESVVRTEMQSLTQLVANNMALLRELVSSHLSGSFQKPANSCRDIPEGSPSGNYWIQTNSSTPVIEQYCDMNRTCCNSTGGWMRVANLDMTNPNQQCPSGFRLVSSPRRSCGVLTTGCTSVTYPVHGVEYSRVCGRVIGYQKGTTNAFFNYIVAGTLVTIDSPYVDGVSLTHGSSPRKHIWTFAAALDEEGISDSICPCTHPDPYIYSQARVPPFVENDYFCDTGSRNRFEYGRFYHQDPLWDGQGCGAQNTCCSFNNPPWFCKHLPQPTRDNIELRLCKDDDNNNPEDIPIEVVELYVQ